VLRPGERTVSALGHAYRVVTKGLTESDAVVLPPPTGWVAGQKKKDERGK